MPEHAGEDFAKDRKIRLSAGPVSSAAACLGKFAAAAYHLDQTSSGRAWRSVTSIAARENVASTFAKTNTFTTTNYRHVGQATARRCGLRRRCETSALQQWLASASPKRGGAQKGRGYGEDCCSEGEDDCWKTERCTCDSCTGALTATSSGIFSGSHSSTGREWDGRRSCQAGRDYEEARGGEGEDCCG